MRAAALFLLTLQLCAADPLSGLRELEGADYRSARDAWLAEPTSLQALQAWTAANAEDWLAQALLSRADPQAASVERYDRVAARVVDPFGDDDGPLSHPIPRYVDYLAGGYLIGEVGRQRIEEYLPLVLEAIRYNPAEWSDPIRFLLGYLVLRELPINQAQWDHMEVHGRRRYTTHHDLEEWYPKQRVDQVTAWFDQLIAGEDGLALFTAWNRRNADHLERLAGRDDLIGTLAGCYRAQVDAHRPGRPVIDLAWWTAHADNLSPADCARLTRLFRDLTQDEKAAMPRRVYPPSPGWLDRQWLGLRWDLLSALRTSHADRIGSAAWQAESRWVGIRLRVVHLKLNGYPANTRDEEEAEFFLYRARRSAASAALWPRSTLETLDAIETDHPEAQATIEAIRHAIDGPGTRLERYERLAPWRHAPNPYRTE